MPTGQIDRLGTGMPLRGGRQPGGPDRTRRSVGCGRVGTNRSHGPTRVTGPHPEVAVSSAAARPTVNVDERRDRPTAPVGPTAAGAGTPPGPVDRAPGHRAPGRRRPTTRIAARIRPGLVRGHGPVHPASPADRGRIDHAGIEPGPIGSRPTVGRGPPVRPGRIEDPMDVGPVRVDRSGSQRRVSGSASNRRAAPGTRPDRTRRNGPPAMAAAHRT